MVPAMSTLCAALFALLAQPADLRWIHDGMPTPQALALVEVLQSAALDALDPDDYDASLGDEPLARLGSRSGQRAFDAALTAAAERYVSDRKTGRVHPRLGGAWLEKPAPGDVPSAPARATRWGW